ncbi:MAG: hypothetical protein V9E85_04020 [Candidatus Nanopelagicales bacterium]|jgi:hypothetical protein
MFLSLLASATEMANGTYPGGASASDPVPTNIEYYGTEWTYMLLAFVVFSAAVFAVTRLNADR